MKGKNSRKKVLRTVCMVLTVLMIAAFGAGASFVLMVISEAPVLDIADAEPDGYRTSVLDKDGNVALTLSDSESNRVYVRLDEMPQALAQAFIAVEDERFYKHHGVDLKGFARAVFSVITSGGKKTQGASTITQQLLKNNVFPGWMNENSFEDKLERKIKEQYLAVQLEQKVSKEWILEKYLNTINLGGGNLGVQTAARYYFDKDVSALTTAECAVLAAITKNPSKYNPAREPEDNALRKDIVLEKMLDQGYISQDEYEKAKEDNVYDRIAAVRETGSTIQIMTYFEDAMMYEILQDLMKAENISEEEAWNLIYRGGLTVCSTEDSAVQEMCENAVNSIEVDDQDTQISLVLLENETGVVRAMVGGRGEKTANLVLNRAVSAERQPGSTIKVIGEYASGFEDGSLTLGTVVDDAPTSYSDGTDVHNADGTYGGMTTIRKAIAESSNIVALKCFNEQGINHVLSDLSDFGITTLNEEDRVESLALGGTKNGVTNLEMTAAYGVLARGGRYIRPIYYTKILDHDGNVLIEKTPEEHEVVRTATAVLLTEAMKDVITTGTGKEAAFEGMSLAGKTGTTTGARDAWMIGYSPYYTCGVWGGLDNGGKQANGAYVRTLWGQVMRSAHEGLSDKGFAGTEEMEHVRICTKCGLRAIEGLCDETVQGDMTRDEIFAPGTAPSGYCNCHEEVELCRDTGEKAGLYCKETVKKVYLTHASKGTADEDYVLPELQACSEHKGIFSPWFDGDGDNPSWWGGNDEHRPDNGSQWDNNDNSEDDNGNEWGSGPENGGNESHWWDVLIPRRPESDEDENGDSDDGGKTNWWDFLF